MIKHKRLHLTLLVIVLFVLAGGSYGWWWFVSGRFPLAGDTSHDFGLVSIQGVAELEHTFTLRNRTSAPVRIIGHKSGCGCADIAVSTDVVAPGEEVHVDLTLRLRRPGRKSTYLTLVLEDFGPQKLWVYAKGEVLRIEREVPEDPFAPDVFEPEGEGTEEGA